MMFPSISSVGLVRFVSVEVVVVTDSVTAEVIVVVSAVVSAPEQAQKLRTIASKSAIARFAFFIFPPFYNAKRAAVPSPGTYCDIFSVRRSGFCISK
jgi:hypothetical protein